ncbi:hypothetical protein [Desertihabitans brevis]|nr:hypothetical protein [Desertihabitans brevis]
MPKPPPDPRRNDGFSWFYRFDHHVTYALLHVMGPPDLDEARDPRTQMKKEYERRKALHEARKHAARAKR